MRARISTLLFVTPVYGDSVVIGRDTYTHMYTQKSPSEGVGPNIFYGYPVELSYSLTIRWVSITYPNGDARQMLTAVGTVDIFDPTDPINLIFIETRRCSVSIRFYDAGEDACTGIPGDFYTWDPFDPDL